MYIFSLCSLTAGDLENTFSTIWRLMSLIEWLGKLKCSPVASGIFPASILVLYWLTYPRCWPNLEEIEFPVWRWQQWWHQHSNIFRSYLTTSSDWIELSIWAFLVTKFSNSLLTTLGPCLWRSEYVSSAAQIETLPGTEVTKLHIH